MTVAVSAPNRTPHVDLPAYFQRIGFVGNPRPTRACLLDLHRAHATHIPFENIDVLLRRPIRLDLPSLQAKLVGARRGGYCFEQNLLFAAALEQVGFDVTRLAARVRYRTTRLLPRTHMALLVRLDGESWLADVGFGAAGLLLPICLTPGELSPQGVWKYRVMEEAGQHVLQLRDGDGWTDLYILSSEPQLPVDYEPPNHFVSTHSDSRFVQTLTVQLVQPEVRHILRNWDLVEDRGTQSTSRKLSGHEELLSVLDSVFGLHLPPATRLEFHDWG